MPIKDPIYGGERDNPSLEDYTWDSSVPYKSPGQKANIQWFEALVGVKVQIYRRFYMG